MAETPKKLSEAEIKKLFSKEAYPPPPEGTFELALVLGGTVSAGCYTAGVLDFLIYAMDIWEEAKGRTNRYDAPKHSTILKAVAGTSGGGVCGAILARAASRDFRTVGPDTDDAMASENPFYDTWVNTLDFAGMTDVDDLSTATLLSFLNGKPIDQAAASLVEWEGAGGRNRDWITEKLPLILTNTNLNGIPYAVDFDGPADQSFVDMGDHARFLIPTIPNSTGVTRDRPDEVVVENGRTGNDVVDWTTFAEFAKATGAFPGGFPPRRLTRPMEQYRYRVVVTPSDKLSSSLPEGEIAGSISPLTPDWDRLRDENGDVPEFFHYLAVDGGAVNNQPVELARAAIAGVNGRNPRGGKDANRGVVLIDPFADESDPMQPIPATAFASLGKLAGGLLGQTRYSTSDMMLMAHPDVFSRFLITPILGDRVGSKAITSSGLGAALGFMCKDFRRHDYFLGRRNAWHYLKEILVLEEDNKLFSNWTAEQKDAHRVTEGDRTYLPLVPLLDGAAVEPATLPWPVGALDVKRVDAQIDKRVSAVIDHITDHNDLSDNWLVRQAINFAVDNFGPRIVTGIASDKLADALKSKGL